MFPNQSAAAAATDSARVTSNHVNYYSMAFNHLKKTSVIMQRRVGEARSKGKLSTKVLITRRHFSERSWLSLMHRATKLTELEFRE